MTELILHHFEISPFAEKIRKVFGVKQAHWRSVLIPAIMPKPDLVALTGGYRKTPVLQIGADIYCDTRLIARVIDQRLPNPPLFASGPLVAAGLQDWSDGAFFPSGAALSLYENAAHIPEPLRKDREDYFDFLNFDRFAADAPHFRSQLRACARLIDAQLADGRPFLHGARPEWTDVGAYFNIWMARANIPSSVALFRSFERLLDWRLRMDALGEGRRDEISADTALDVARASRPAAIEDQESDDPGGAKPGDVVVVTPTDHGRVPVRGALLAANDLEIVVARRDDRAGDVAVHFPRLGYRIDAAA
jgi:glutathione S-transferase